MHVVAWRGSRVDALWVLRIVIRVL